MNRAEKLVSDLCRRSFLSLWSYSNPRGKDNKELCDVLVVCDPDIIIISVKEIRLSASGNLTTDWSRWKKRAIEKSSKQIYGAERWIENATHVIQRDGSEGIAFPEFDKRRIHRLAVAMGADGKMPLIFGDFGKGYIHVFDEISLEIIMRELDTITDFVKYLAEKEIYYNSGKEIGFTGGEEDLLAYYLTNGECFPPEFTRVLIDDEYWKSLSEEEDYKKRAKANKVSYAWDNLIEILCKDFELGRMEFGNSLTEVELITRIMAKEGRFERRVLAKTFVEFLDLSSKRIVRSRFVPSFSDIMYVFLACSHDEERQYRVAELGGRCFVIRGLYPKFKTVIGICTERPEQGKGYSLTTFYLYKEDWTPEDERKMRYAQNEFGWFKNPRETMIDEREYPK